MLKLSSLLEQAAIDAAKNLLENGLDEANLPGLESYLVSKNNKCPKGHVLVGNVKVDETPFYVFQKF